MNARIIKDDFSGEVDIEGIRDALRKANDLLNNALGWTEEVYTGK